MINSRKKGFTLVELVIVIAVVAILAAVLIPTFSNLVRKANISSDTVVAKNLNTAAITSNADTFEEAIAAAKEYGYLLANLNAKANDCYFVWEDDSNQFVLYDLENSEVIYSNSNNYGEIDSSWCFTVSNSTVAESVKNKLTDITIKKTVTDVKDLKQALAEGGEIYIDESVILNKDNYLNLTNANIEINFGNSSLMSDGTLDGIFPITVNSGTVVINGGIIGASGTNIDLDGKTFKSPVNSLDGSIVTINNTEFNGNDDATIQFSGTATLNNVKVNGGYIYSYRNGKVTVNDCEISRSRGPVIWVTNTISENSAGQQYVGTSTLTINGGKYETVDPTEDYGTVSVYNGTININDGEFKSGNGHIFGLKDTTCPKIVITGGTFNNKTFDELCELGKDAWLALCAGEYNIEISDDKTKVTITR